MDRVLASAVRSAALVMLLSLTLGAAPGCSGTRAHRPNNGPEAISLLGKPLTPPPLAPETRERFERRLAEAQAACDEAPQSEDAIVWLGRRTAYLGLYNDAINIYSDGLAIHPESAQLLRHRGHRYLTLRRFDDAVADLRRAAALTEGGSDEIEPDGLPNARNEPRSTLKGNIWYHLGVALYCQGRFGEASDAFAECLLYSTWNDDMLVATTAWLHRSLRRAGRDDAAASILDPIHDGMDIIENAAYLRTLLFVKGEVPLERALTDPGDGVSRASLAYGIAAELWARGQAEEAIEICRRIVKADQWAAFGSIAAEADLARMGLSADAE